MEIKEKGLQMFHVARVSGVRLWFLWSQHGISLVVIQNGITLYIFCPFLGISFDFYFKILLQLSASWHSWRAGVTCYLDTMPWRNTCYASPHGMHSLPCEIVTDTKVKVQIPRSKIQIPRWETPLYKKWKIQIKNRNTKYKYLKHKYKYWKLK